MKRQSQRPWIIAWGLLGCVQRGEVLAPDSDVAPDLSGHVATGVTSGHEHSCAILNDVTYCWGANALGQLGLPGSENQPSAVESLGTTRFRQLSAGAQHNCGVDDLGQVYCWGDNARGQLGQGDRSPRSIPIRVELPTGATSISSGFNHSCALLLDATLYCWGQNKEGQLGQGDPVPSADETIADGLSPLAVGSGNWRAVSTGDGHTCAIQLDGSLWCWGRNSEHELGNDARIQVREPIRVSDPGPWLSVAAGQHHTCGIKADFSLWCWGLNTASETREGFPLGIANAAELELPTRVGDAENWTRVATKTFHTCALNRQGELWCWGRNTEGQLGLVDLDPRATPVHVGNDYAAVAVGLFSTCALTDGGAVQCTGENDSGQLGTGDFGRRSEFTGIDFVEP